MTPSAACAIWEIKMEKTIGILGGMGPLATADLFTKIINLTKADGDNDHIRVFIDSNSKIPDRTQAILHGGADPLPYMIASAKKLETIGASVIIIPCNTAHYFFEATAESVTTPFIHMIEETAKAVPEGAAVGLLATTATVNTKIYHRALEKYGVRLLCPDDKRQTLVMDAMFAIKGGRAPDRAGFTEVLDSLKEKGAEYFIMGCTEMPMVFSSLSLSEPVIDPATVLAKAAIRFCGKQIRE